jgi:hypothetical protein
MTHVYTRRDLDLSKGLDDTIILEVPVPTRRNGTLQAYVFLMNNNFIGEDFDDVYFYCFCDY